MSSKSVLDEEALRYLGGVQSRLDELGDESQGADADEVQEERLLLVSNALREVQGALPRVVRDPTGSRVLESLLEVAAPEQLADCCRALFDTENSRMIELMTHPTGSFVLEKLVNKIAQGSDECSEIFNEFCFQLSRTDLLRLLSDSRGSFVLRILVARMVSLQPDQVVPTLEQGHVTLTRASLEASAKSALESMVDKLCESGSELGRSMRMPQVGASLSVIVGTCARVDRAAVDRIAATCLGDKLQHLEGHATSKSGSRFVEAVVACCTDELVADMYSNHLRGRLMEICEHQVANFMLQRFVLRSGQVSSGLLLGVLDELSEHCAYLLSTRPGVLLALARACSVASDRDCQVRFASALADVGKSPELGSSEKPSSTSTIEAIRSTQRRPVGSLIVQTMLEFKHAQLVADELQRLPSVTILEMVRDGAWSRVVEVFLRGDADEKRKRKVIKHLLGNLVALAKQSGGSRVVEAAYAFAGSVALRRKVVEELAEGADELRDDTWGRFVVKKCRVDAYLAKSESWEQVETSREAKKRVFAELFDDEPTKPAAAEEREPRAAGTSSESGAKKRAKPSRQDRKLRGAMASLGFGAARDDREETPITPRERRLAEADSGNVDFVLGAIAEASRASGAPEPSSSKTKKKSKKRGKKDDAVAAGVDS